MVTGSSMAKRRVGAPALALLFSIGGVAACGSDDASAFCDTASSVVDDELANSIDPTDPDSMDAVIDAFDQMADSAPDEIADDAALARDTFTAMVKAMKDGDFEAAAEIDVEAMEQAAERLEAYTSEHC